MAFVASTEHSIHGQTLVVPVGKTRLQPGKEVVHIARWVRVQVVRLPDVLIGTDFLVVADDYFLGEPEVVRLLCQFLNAFFKPARAASGLESLFVAIVIDLEPTDLVSALLCLEPQLFHILGLFLSLAPHLSHLRLGFLLLQIGLGSLLLKGVLGLLKGINLCL